jgi:hypothetical protein
MGHRTARRLRRAGALAIVLATRGAGAQDLGADLDRYAAAEYGTNGAFVGVGLANVGVGTWALTRDDAFARGMGVPLVVVGAVQVSVGATYLGIILGIHRRGREGLARDPIAWRRTESARVRRIVGLFPIFLAVDIAAIVAGAVALGVGLSRGDDGVSGAGAGLLATTPLQLALDVTALVFAGRYHRALEVSPGGITLRW